MKLRITAALLGCASQKDLCIRFHEVNPGTTFDLERSYKWMLGRALPRASRVYEDWATLLGTNSPIANLQSCTVDEFLDLLCDRHKVSRDALTIRVRSRVASLIRGIVDPTRRLTRYHNHRSFEIAKREKPQTLRGCCPNVAIAATVA